MIAIVTDSTICIPKKDAEEHGVYMVSNSYSVGKRAYHESYSDHNGNFTQRIFENAAICKTAQAPVSAFISAFQALINDGCEVLCIVLSSRLSGAFSSACIAAREVDANRIAVVDSLTTAGGLFLLAKRARALAKQGMPLFDIAAEITRLRERVGIAFSVDDMSALRRSGRLGFVPQSIGTVLNIRPILLCVNGTVVARGHSRGAAGRVREMINKIPDSAKEILVHYIGEASDAKPLLKGIKERFPNLDAGLYRIGPVLGVHLGAGVLGAAWINN